MIGLIALVGIVATFAAFSQNNAKSSSLLQFELEEQEFRSYMSAFNKNYETEAEFAERLKIYRDNSALIRMHNSRGKTWSLGHNEFSDMSLEEFRSIYLPRPYDLSRPRNEVEMQPLEALPSSVDWRTQNVVTAVKNQGQCGSCWAFSTTGSVEGAWALSGKTLVSLSEQELVDCSTSYGNAGCNGGLMDDGFKFVIDHGLTLESNYPYTAVNGNCNTVLEGQAVASIKSYTDVATNNPTALQTAVAKQPVSVAVEANQFAWQFYKGGIVSDDCGTRLDHGVLVVGYNTANTPPYWIVKNSWGASWGEQGYIRIALGSKPAQGICGINMSPSFPNVNS